MPDARASSNESLETVNEYIFQCQEEYVALRMKIVTEKLYIFRQISAMLFLLPAVMICLISNEFHCASTP